MQKSTKRLLLICCGLHMVLGAAGVVFVAAATILPQFHAPRRPGAALLFLAGLFLVSLWASIRLLGWKRRQPDLPIACGGDRAAHRDGASDRGPTAA